MHGVVISISLGDLGHAIIIFLRALLTFKVTSSFMKSLFHCKYDFKRLLHESDLNGSFTHT